MSSSSDLIQRTIEEKQKITMERLSEAYQEKLDDDMGKLHNQFVSFISAAKIPLPHVLLVLDILRQETVEQARKRYLGDLI